METKEVKRGRTGRPPKFTGPRRPVTVTLPESTLQQLGLIDRDRARAIVKAANAALPNGESGKARVEVVEMAPGIGIILVGPSSYLKRIKWLRLVEVAPMRFLLSQPPGTPPDSLEVELLDLLETVPPSEPAEHAMLDDLRCLMRAVRRGRSLSKAEMLFVDTVSLARQDSNIIVRKF